MSDHIIITDEAQNGADHKLAELIRLSREKADAIVADANASIAKTKAAARAAQTIRVNPSVLETVATQTETSKRIAAQTRSSLEAFQANLAAMKTRFATPQTPSAE